MIDSSIIDVDPDEFDRILSVNLKGVLYGCQAAGKVMVAQRGGSIINMASAAVLSPAPALATPSARPAWRSDEVDGRRGRRVRRAGGTRRAGLRSEQHDGAPYTNPDGTVNEAVQGGGPDTDGPLTPLRRVGETADVAVGVLYLASDASSFVTGQLLSPDGGVSMHD